MKVRSNKAGVVFEYYYQRLAKSIDRREAKAMMFILFEEMLKIERQKILADYDIRLNESELLNLHFAVERLEKQEALQYILGRTDFYELQFKVNPDVLIPRQETEELVELVIKDQKGKESVKIIDIGTGSGCIAISLKKNLERSEVSAMDVSSNALQIAQENANINDTTINFIEDSILKPEKEYGQHDVIVSNPPYVRELEKAEMKENVLNNEPHIALFVPDNDALKFYNAIAQFGLAHLNKAGIIYCEINQYLGKETKLLFESNDFETSLIKDMNGRDRFIKARKKQ